MPIATDGESYGHHHRFGDMALAFALRRIENSGDVALTNYGEFLEKCPPAWEVDIHENSSWSCSHGVERWRSDCGCRLSGHAGSTGIVLAPIGFLSDHLEVLYDLDVEAAGVCAQLGIPMMRAATVGGHPRFVQMIRELIEERLDPATPKLALGRYGPSHDVCPGDCCRYPTR